MALAVAFPFLFSYTQPPSTNFWPLMAAGLCGWVVAVAWNARSAGRVNTVRGGWMDRSEMATWLGAGLLLAAVLASAIGLLQYFGAAPGLDPWVHASKPGQAMGNLRQRNQQATLLSMGLWALLWVVAQTEAHLRASSAGGSSAQAGADLHGGGRPWPLWLVGILTAWALALLAVGSAATASRTGLAQWCVIGVLLALLIGVRFPLIQRISARAVRHSEERSAPTAQGRFHSCRLRRSPLYRRGRTGPGIRSHRAGRCVPIADLLPREHRCLCLQALVLESEQQMLQWTAGYRRYIARHLQIVRHCGHYGHGEDGRRPSKREGAGGKALPQKFVSNECSGHFFLFGRRKFQFQGFSTRNLCTANLVLGGIARGQFFGVTG